MSVRIKCWLFIFFLIVITRTSCTQCEGIEGQVPAYSAFRSGQNVFTIERNPGKEMAMQKGCVSTDGHTTGRKWFTRPAKIPPVNFAIALIFQCCRDPADLSAVNANSSRECGHAGEFRKFQRSNEAFSLASSNCVRCCKAYPGNAQTVEIMVGF